MNACLSMMFVDIRPILQKLPVNLYTVSFRPRELAVLYKFYPFYIYIL